MGKVIRAVIDVICILGAFLGIAVDFLSIMPPITEGQFLHFPRFYMFLINVAAFICGLLFVVCKEVRIYHNREDLRTKSYYLRVSTLFFVIAFIGHLLLLSFFSYKNQKVWFAYFRDANCWIPIFLSFLLSALPTIWKNLRVSSFEKVKAFFANEQKRDERRKKEEKIVAIAEAQVNVQEVATDAEMKAIEKKVHAYLHDHPSSKETCADKLGISKDLVTAVIKRNKNQYSYNRFDKCWWTTELPPVVEEQPPHHERQPAEPRQLEPFQIKLLSLINDDNSAPLWDFAEKMATTKRKIVKLGIRPLMQLGLIIQEEDKWKLTDDGRKYLRSNANADSQTLTPV